VLFVSPMKAVIFAIFILVLQQFDGNILGPKILGDSIGIQSFWIIFAVLVFGNLLGLVGMLVGVPLFAVVYNLIRSFLRMRLSRKGYPENTTFYLDGEPLSAKTDSILILDDSVEEKELEDE